MKALCVFVVASVVLGSVGAASGWQQGPGPANGQNVPKPYAGDGNYRNPLPQQPHPYAYPAPSVPNLPPPYPASPGTAQAPQTPGFSRYGQAPSPQTPGYSGYGQAPSPAYPYPPHHNPYYDGVSPKDMLANTIEWVLSFPSTVMGHFSNFLDDNLFPRVPATSGTSDGNAPRIQTRQPPRDPAAPGVPGASGYPEGR